MAGERKDEMLQGASEPLHGERECLVQPSEQLACQHAMEEEPPVGEEGCCWERTKVLGEASNRLCFLKAYTNDQGLDEGAAARAAGARERGAVRQDTGMRA